jgi:hypothetical protein
MCMSIVYLPDLQPLFLPLNQWVQGSSPWEDTKRHPQKDVFLFVYMGFYKKIVNKCIFLAYLIKKLYLCSLK